MLIYVYINYILKVTVKVNRKLWPLVANEHTVELRRQKKITILQKFSHYSSRRLKENFLHAYVGPMASPIRSQKLRQRTLLRGLWLPH